MAYEQKPNTGSLFKNNRKETDSHPDYKGSALIDGFGECWLDAWINAPEGGGKKWMKLTFKAKEARPTDTRQTTQASTELDDEVPF